MLWPELFFHLSAELIHSADVWCPFSHSTFELKLSRLCMKQKLLAPLYTQAVSHSLHLHVFSMSAQDYHSAFCSPLCSKMDSWTDGQIAHTYLFGALVLEYMVSLIWNYICLIESVISSPSGYLSKIRGFLHYPQQLSLAWNLSVAILTP